MGKIIQPTLRVYSGAHKLDVKLHEVIVPPALIRIPSNSNLEQSLREMRTSVGQLIHQAMLYSNEKAFTFVVYGKAKNPEGNRPSLLAQTPLQVDEEDFLRTEVTGRQFRIDISGIVREKLSDGYVLGPHTDDPDDETADNRFILRLSGRTSEKLRSIHRAE